MQRWGERLLQAVKDAAIGVKNGSQWSHGLDNSSNRRREHFSPY